MNDKVWDIALKTMAVMAFVIICLFLSSCGHKDCNTLEYLGNSLCH